MKINDLSTFLVSHQVTPTPNRVRILKAIHYINSEFSFSQIQTKIKPEQPTVSTACISNTLVLFKNKGLIKEVHYVNNGFILNGKRGRPETKYICDEIR